MRLINYDDLLERLHRVTTIRCTTFMGGVFVEAEPFIEVINNMPIVKPKAEKWEHIWDAPDGTYKGRCTKCGFVKVFIEGHDAQYKFCPYCGCHMKEGEEHD